METEFAVMEKEMGIDKWKETLKEKSFLLVLLVTWFPNCGVMRLEFF